MHAQLLAFLLLISLILCCELVAEQCDDSYLAVCTIVKEEPDLVEWIEYHRRMGVSKFYLFDHNSSIPLLNDILPYVRSGLVEYRFVVQPAAQWPVFRQCLKEFRDLHTFMAFIDVDEFIVVKDKAKKIPDILQDYEDFGGLVLNWRMMGSSGHIHRPPGGVLKNYYKCGNNFHVKSIVNPRYVLDTGYASHSFIYIDGKFATDTTKQVIVYGPVNPGNLLVPPDYLFDVMYINHYCTKSYEDYLVKVARGRADTDPPTPRYDDEFNMYESWAPFDCEYLEMPEDTDTYCSPYG